MNFIKKTIWILFLPAFIYSCNSVSENNLPAEINSTSTAIISETTDDKNISFHIFMIDSTNKSAGFGYDILMNDQRYIHQTTIPAVSGNQFFKTEEAAKTVASFVCYKIQNNLMPPTISTHELDSLGISIK